MGIFEIVSGRYEGIRGIPPSSPRDCKEFSNFWDAPMGALELNSYGAYDIMLLGSQGVILLDVTKGALCILKI